MSRLRRLHGGQLALWGVGLIVALGSIAIGIAFIFDGTGVTSSPTFTPARHLLTAAGVPSRNVMNLWGGVFMALGAYSLLPSLSHKATLPQRRRHQIPVTALWAAWSLMFATYAAGHHGYGFIGAITWAMIAAAGMAVLAALKSHIKEG